MNNTIARLKREMKKHHIRQSDVAANCGVDRTMVNKVVNAVAKSAKVVSAAQRMILAAKMAEMDRAS